MTSSDPGNGVDIGLGSLDMFMTNKNGGCGGMT